MGKLEEALQIVGQVYEAGLGEGDWAAALCALADFCGVANATLVVTGAQPCSPAIVAPRADPDMVDAYARDWWRKDPTLPRSAAVPQGRIATLADIDREGFLNSAYHKEYWRHLGFGSERIFANLLVGDDAFACCGLQTHARQDAIEGEAAGRFSLLIPHLVNVMKIARRLRRMEFEIAASGPSTNANCAGVMILDADLRILFADEKADYLLASGSGLCANRGRLNIDEASAHEKLRAAVAACQDIQLQRIVREIPIRKARRLSVQPFYSRTDLRLAGPGPAAMVLVSDPNHEREARIERLRSAFRFTRAEAELAFEMLKGDGRGAAAARCGISINTARTHLMRIFEKTAVSRQAELIGVLMNAVGAA